MGGDGRARRTTTRLKMIRRRPPPPMISREPAIRVAYAVALSSAAAWGAADVIAVLMPVTIAPMTATIRPKVIPAFTAGLLTNSSFAATKREQMPDLLAAYCAPFHTRWQESARNGLYRSPRRSIEASRDEAS